MQGSIEEVCHCSQLLGATIDLATPINTKLTAYFKRSFAHHTTKDRWPVILTKLIDSLVRSKEEICDVYGMDSLDDLKATIGGISKLKHDIQTNKKITPLDTKYPDAREYNEYIKKSMDQNISVTYFSSLWLFAECYIYRKIAEMFLQTKTLQEFDYFAKQKEEAYNAALPLILSMAQNINKLTKGRSSEMETHDRNALKDDFNMLLKLNLWGNKCDLSLSSGSVDKNAENIIDNVGRLDENILCNQSDDIYSALCRNTMFEIIDFVVDNAGYEIFADFCLADYLTTHKFCKQVRFFVKMFPWFISDVTKRDVYWILERLQASDQRGLSELGSRWSMYFKEKKWVVEESYFWTSNLPFCDMFEKDEGLFRKLARSKCTFYKGDLNYRKLLGDRNWEPTTPFEDALEGYHPCRLCALRTLKADLICGLTEGLSSQMDEKDKDWLVSGNYGVIQYSNQVKKLI